MTPEQLRAATSAVLPVLHDPNGPVARAVRDVQLGALELSRMNSRVADAVKKLAEQVGPHAHLTTGGTPAAVKAITAAARAQSTVGISPAWSTISQPWARRTGTTPVRPWAPIAELTGRLAGSSAAFTAIMSASAVDPGIARSAALTKLTAPWAKPATLSAMAASPGADRLTAGAVAAAAAAGIVPAFAGSAAVAKLAEELTKHARPPFGELTGTSAALRAVMSAGGDSRIGLTGMVVMGQSLQSWMKDRMPLTAAGLFGRTNFGPDSTIGKPAALYGPDSGAAPPWIEAFGPAGPSGHLTSMFAAVRESQEAMRHVMHAWMPTESIADMLRTFAPLADRGFRAAHFALHAAMNVVRALRRNDVRGLELVRDFMVDWLDFTRDKLSWDLVNSAVIVLLDTRLWLPREPWAWSYDPIDRLRRLTLVQNRAVTRLSTDPQKRLGGRPLVSLQEPVTELSDGTILTRGDLQPDHQVLGPEDAFVEITDRRLEAIWGRFTAREREIIYMRGHARMTWGDAAVMCGATVAEGELLRRKVKRMAARYTDRAAM